MLHGLERGRVDKFGAQGWDQSERQSRHQPRAILKGNKQTWKGMLALFALAGYSIGVGLCLSQARALMGSTFVPCSVLITMCPYVSLYGRPDACMAHACLGQLGQDRQDEIFQSIRNSCIKEK